MGTASSRTETDRSSGTTRPEYAMRTPPRRATSSSAYFNDTRSSAMVTVSSSGGRGSPCHSAAQGAVVVPNIAKMPPTVIKNRIASFLRLVSRTNRNKTHQSPGPRCTDVEHLGQNSHGLVGRLGHEGDRDPLVRQCRVGLDLEVVPALELCEDTGELHIVEQQRPAGPGEIVRQPHIAHDRGRAARVEHSPFAGAQRHQPRVGTPRAA